MSENYFTSFTNRGGDNSILICCTSCRLEQVVTPLVPYPNHKFSQKMKFKSPDEELKWGDFIKSDDTYECRKCNGVIYKQELAIVIQDGWSKVAGIVE